METVHLTAKVTPNDSSDTGYTRRAIGPCGPFVHSAVLSRCNLCSTAPKPGVCKTLRMLRTIGKVIEWVLSVQMR
jgi:hypothetical protein